MCSLLLIAGSAAADPILFWLITTIVICDNAKETSVYTTAHPINEKFNMVKVHIRQTAKAAAGIMNAFLNRYVPATDRMMIQSGRTPNAKSNSSINRCTPFAFLSSA